MRQGIRIRFTGTGGAFDTLLGNTAAVVEYDDHVILVDCGHAVFPRLVATGMAPALTGILITHLHDDHCGSLSTLLLYRKHRLHLPPLPVYVPTPAWAGTLRDFLSHSLGNADRLADFRPLTALPGAFALDTRDRHVTGMQTWAYGFRHAGHCLVCSGDLGDPDFLFTALDQMHLRGARVYHEISFSEGGGHTHYTRLHPWMAHYEIRGCHCDPSLLPADCRIPLVAHDPSLLFP